MEDAVVVLECVTQKVFTFLKSTIWATEVLACEPVSHLLWRDQRDVLNAEGLKDVLVEVCVELHATDALHEKTDEVNTELRTSLVD